MGDYICMSVFSSLAKCLVMSHLSLNLMYSVPQLSMFKYKQLVVICGTLSALIV